MAGISSGLGIGGIVFLLLGGISIAAGIIVLIAQQGQAIQWYVWLLIILGIILLIIGVIMLIIAFTQKDKEDMKKKKKSKTNSKLDYDDDNEDEYLID